MRLSSLQISGFKPFPFCATFSNGTNPSLVWRSSAFKILFPTKGKMLSALIGPNSSGKSSVLYALGSLFGSATKLGLEVFNMNNTQDPIAIEAVFCGKVKLPDIWHADKCKLLNGRKKEYQLTLVSAWPHGEARSDFIRLEDGSLHKIGKNDKPYVTALEPRFRMIPAVSSLTDEGNPEKKNLLSDIIEEFIQRSEQFSNRSIRKKIDKKLTEIRNLLDRETASNHSAWKDIAEIERLLSEAIAPITPDSPTARLTFDNVLPTIAQIFQKSRVKIEDGVELDLSDHGSGLQRTFVISALNVWNQWIGQKTDEIDYIIGIEEPELYLHPHATRVCLATFAKIAARDQLIFTTHSSEFVNHVDFANITCFRRKAKDRRVINPDLGSISAKSKEKVQRFLIENRSDMLFARAVLLVEGQAEQHALPGFAQTLGLALDANGVSIVNVGGKENFEVYHQILNAFAIPHAILADGDGNMDAANNKYKQWVEPDCVFVLPQDFEHTVVEALSDVRFLEIVNLSRKREGKKPENNLDYSVPFTSKNLADSWFNKFKEDVLGDVAKEYQHLYKDDLKVLQPELEKIAQQILSKGHLFPSVTAKRKAAKWVRIGKPLVGRVLGDDMKAEEILKLPTVEMAIRKVVELAQ